MTPLLDLAERRRYRFVYPLLAEPGIAVLYLDNGAQGTILAIEDLAGQLAYRVQLTDGTRRHILATALDITPIQAIGAC